MAISNQSPHLNNDTASPPQLREAKNVSTHTMHAHLWLAISSDEDVPYNPCGQMAERHTANHLGILHNKFSLYHSIQPAHGAPRASRCDMLRPRSEICVQTETVTALAPSCSHHASLLVLPDPLLEEVWVSESCEQPVSNKLYVLGHHVTVHADQVARQGVANKLPLRCDSPANDVVHDIIGKLVL